MHIHWKRTLLAFSLAGLGVLALAIRPALQSNVSSEAQGEKSSVTHKLSHDELGKPFSINGTWDLLKSPEYAYYRLKTGEANPFKLLAAAFLSISVIQDEQGLSLALSEGGLETISPWDKAKIEYYCYPMGRTYKEQADGYDYICYNQHLIAKLTIESSFFGPSIEGYILVQTMIDPQKQTLDAVHFSYYEGRKEYSYSPAGTMIGSFNAPSRYGDDTVERALRQTAEAIMEVDYHAEAENVASRLEAKLAQLAKMRPRPEAVSPSSWGSYQAVVEELREELQKAVVLSKELNYFDSPAWKSFLESDDFFRVFGDVSGEREDEGFNY